jgi:hypothetical protein
VVLWVFGKFFSWKQNSLPLKFYSFIRELSPLRWQWKRLLKS